MEYEVKAVLGAGDIPPGQPYNQPRTVLEAQEDIARVYRRAQELGGRVIAGHTLACGPVQDSEDVEDILKERTDVLFLVLELPDDYAPGLV